MKKIHVFFTIITFIAIIIISSSCMKDYIPETDGIDTVYITEIVYYDSIVMFDARYIDSTIAINQSEAFLNSDSTQFVFGSLNNEFVLDSVEYASVRFLGGYRGVDKPKPQINYDHFKPVVEITKDTIYKPYVQPISYSIFEVKEGNTSYMDTVFYDKRFKVLRSYGPRPMQDLHSDYCYDCIEPFLNAWSDILTNDSFELTLFLNDFETLSHKINGKNIYMFDIFPFWKSFGDSSTFIVFYIE